MTTWNQRTGTASTSWDERPNYQIDNGHLLTEVNLIISNEDDLGIVFHTGVFYDGTNIWYERDRI